MSALNTESKPIASDVQRMLDLIRYQRAELHRVNLITDDEYLLLLSDSKAVGRLESYDQLRKKVKELETALHQIMDAYEDLDKDKPGCVCGGCIAKRALGGAA